ncbi:MAG: DUF5668 domain-containing protein [Treponema sp.]|jgi:hypothetical protein|nr:DUF5668 domain-containing protein [Treponema sp.]
MQSSRRIAAWAVFIIGFFLMLLGVISLVRSIAGISRLSIFVAFLFLVVGCLFAVLAIKLNKRVVYLFFASLFCMVGFLVFFVALGVIPGSFLIKAWPLAAVFSGLALLPAGWRYYGTFRARYVVPSCVFVALGIVFLIFSFDIVTFSFKQFIVDWWPLLIVLAGIILVLGSLGSRNSAGDKGP